MEFPVANARKLHKIAVGDLYWMLDERTLYPYVYQVTSLTREGETEEDGFAHVEQVLIKRSNDLVEFSDDLRISIASLAWLPRANEFLLDYLAEHKVQLPSEEFLEAANNLDDSLDSVNVSGDSDYSETPSNTNFNDVSSSSSSEEEYESDLSSDEEEENFENKRASHDATASPTSVLSEITFVLPPGCNSASTGIKEGGRDEERLERELEISREVNIDTTHVLVDEF